MVDINLLSKELKTSKTLIYSLKLWIQIALFLWQALYHLFGKLHIDLNWSIRRPNNRHMYFGDRG